MSLKKIGLFCFNVSQYIGFMMLCVAFGYIFFKIHLPPYVFDMTVNIWAIVTFGGLSATCLDVALYYANRFAAYKWLINSFCLLALLPPTFTLYKYQSNRALDIMSLVFERFFLASMIITIIICLGTMIKINFINPQKFEKDRARVLQTGLPAIWN